MGLGHFFNLNREDLKMGELAAWGSLYWMHVVKTAVDDASRSTHGSLHLFLRVGLQ